MLQRKRHSFYQAFAIEGRLKLIKTIHRLIHLFMKIFVAFLLAPMVCVSHVFVYDVVNVTKPPSYLYAQVTTELTLYLG